MLIFPTLAALSLQNDVVLVTIQDFSQSSLVQQNWVFEEDIKTNCKNLWDDKNVYILRRLYRLFQLLLSQQNSFF